MLISIVLCTRKPLKMSKRNGTIVETSATKKPKHYWSLGLLESMNDAKNIVKKTEKAVVIRDKYPKAKLHYLVLPYEDLSSIYKLTSTHVSLLNELKQLFEEIEKENPTLQLRAGFHAVPSMQRMHMHIISKDMISQSMKTKIHWNSFNTKHFIPLHELMERLKSDGKLQKISEDEHKQLMATPLKCNQCPFLPKNMPHLKEHLLTHAL